MSNDPNTQTTNQETNESNEAQPDLKTAEGRGQHMAQIALQQPERIPAKFRKQDGTIDVDALAKSYTELESRMHGAPGTDPTSADVSGSNQSSETTTESLLEAETGQQSTAGEDGSATSFAEALADPKQPEPNKAWEQAQQELSTKGELSEATTKALTEMGVPEAIIQSTVSAFKLQQQQSMERAAELVGGKEQLTATFEWAKKNLSVEQRKELAKALQGPNGEMVLAGLHAKAQSAGATPEVTAGTQVDTSYNGPSIAPDQNATIKPFADQQELQAAMTDPRYYSDPSYRRMVAKRLGAGVGVDPSKYDDSPVT